MLPSYSQRDARWSEKTLGKSGNPTVGQMGCTVTCLAMASSAFPPNGTDPLALVDRMGESGFIDGGSLLWMSAAKALGLRFGYRYATDKASRLFANHMLIKHAEAEARIWHLTRMGVPVLIHVAYPGSGTPNHWVVTDPPMLGDRFKDSMSELPIIDPVNGIRMRFTDKYADVYGLAFMVGTPAYAEDGWKAAVLGKALEVEKGIVGATGQLIDKVLAP